MDWRLRIKSNSARLALLVCFCVAVGVNLCAAITIEQITRPGQPDLFDSLISSSASFDMDSPVEAKTSLDPSVAVAGGQVVLRLEATALDESLTAPDTLSASGGLEFHAGGRGQRYEPTGGMRLRPVTTVLYRATVPHAGTFTIPSFQVMAYGKAVTVPETTLIVTAKGSGSGAEPLRLILDVPRNGCYVGQLLKIPLILPLPDDGSHVMAMAQSHITGEFIFAEQFSPGMRQGTVERDGKTFQAFVEEVLITPLRAGPQELIGQATSYVLRRNPSRPDQMESANELIDSDPTPLNVLPLPKDGVLPGFNGAVGNFQIEMPALSTNRVRAGEPLTLTVQIHGDGNLGRLTAPPAPTLPGWQIFPPTDDNLSPNFVQMRGYATFKYTLIPMSDQITETPAIPYSFFDPDKKDYVDLTIPPTPIKVDPAPGALAQMPIEAAVTNSYIDEFAANEPEPVLSGLAKSPGSSTRRLTPLQQRAWFWLLQLLPAGALFGLWAVERRRRYLVLHPEVIRKRQARRGLRRQLRLARQAASARDAGGFVLRGTNALREACAPHSAANPGALICADVLQELPESEQHGRPGEAVRTLFKAADALRFGGSVNDSSALLALQPDLEQVLEELKERL